MKGYPACLSTSGKDRFWRFINRDASRSLSQLKDNKVMKKKNNDVSITVEESKALVQKAQKLSEKKPLIEKVPSELDDSVRSKNGLFSSSEDSSINDESLFTKSDSSELSYVIKTGLSKSGGCNVSCHYPKCIYTTNEDEPLVDCVRCMRRFHFNCQYAKDNKSFNHAINDNFIDGTKLCYDCCLECYELKFHSKTGRPQRTSVCNRIYTVARRTVSFFQFRIVYIFNDYLVESVNHTTMVCYLFVMGMLTLGN